MGFPGGCGGRSSAWGTSPVGTCGQEACLVGLELTGGLNGTMMGAAGQTGCSEEEMQSQDAYVGSRMTHWFRSFFLEVSYLSRTRCSMLGRRLISCRGARGLWLMHSAGVMREGLWGWRKKDKSKC